MGLLTALALLPTPHVSLLVMLDILSMALLVAHVTTRATGPAPSLLGNSLLLFPLRNSCVLSM